MKKTILSIGVIFCGIICGAQVKMPQPSPTQTIMQDFGLGSINLTYSRPVAKGRKVFGDLVPTFERPSEASALIRAWLADDRGRADVASQLPAAVADASWTTRARHVLNDLDVLLQPTAAAIQHPSSPAVGAGALR